MPIQIPKPLDHQDFERKIKVLFRFILKDPSCKRHGRRGQKQLGVDVLGLRGGDKDKVVGVQCKWKGQGEKLTEDEVRGEVNKALQFKPHLSEYFIVTTAPSDAELDKLERELSVPKSKDRPRGMRVCIWGWQTLEEEIQRYPAVIKEFDPSYTFHIEKLENKIDRVAQEVGRLLSIIQPFVHSFAPLTADSATPTPLENQINEYADLVQNNPSVALPLLEKLLENHGNTVTSPVRFRIVSNIAGCRLNLGDTKVAAEGFLEAFKLDSQNPKAVANKALGLLLNKDWHNLRSFAEDHFQKDPDNARLAAYYIHGLIDGGEISNPLDHVPGAVRNTPEVTVANVRWLMKRGDGGTWREAAKAAHKVYPQNDEILELYACALLEQVIKGSVFVYGRGLSDVDLQNVQTAIGIYEPLWSKIRDIPSGVRNEQAFIPANLIVAYRISDLTEDAIRIGNEAITRFPQSEELKIALAAVFFEQGKYKRALDLISGLEGNPQISIMRLEVAMVNKDWPTIYDLVENQLDSFPEKKRTFPVAVGVWAKVELAPVEERRSILEKYQGDFQSDACALIVLAQCSRMYGFDDLVQGYYMAAVAAVEEGDGGIDSRTSVAQESMVHGQYNTVVNILDGFVPIDRMSSALLLLAEAFASIYPIRQRTIDFFEQLPPQIRDSYDFTMLEGTLRINRGDPHGAINLLSRAFEEKACAESLILLIAAHQHAGDSEAIKSLLLAPNINSLSGSSTARLELCGYLINSGEIDQAINIGYEALIEGVNSGTVVAQYLTLTLSLLPYLSNMAYGEVASGLWVRFRSCNGRTYDVLVDEAEDRLWGARADHTNAFIAKSLGKKVGDTFEYTNAIGMSENWTVFEIKPRWLQAFHYLNAVFNQMYPEEKRFASISITEDDIPRLLSTIRQHGEAKYAQAGPYLQFKIPMAFVAGDSIGGSIAFANYLFSIGENIHVTFETENEHSIAQSWIESNRCSGAVMDALTAWRAAQLGIFPILKKCLGPLVIPANEMAIVRSMVEFKVRGDSRESTTVRYHKGEYIRHTVTPEQQRKMLDSMRGLITKIEEECRIETVVIPNELPDPVEQILSSHVGGHFVCPILARGGKLLLCEDMIMRRWAMDLLDVEGVWLQAVLSYALENEILPHQSYSDALVQLAWHRHCHIPITVHDLISVLERDESPNLGQLAILCTTFKNKLADRDSHIGVVVGFINRIWSDGRYQGDQVTQPTNIVLNALLLGEDGERDSWGPVVYMKLNSAPQNYFAGWCREHPYSGS